MLKKERWIWYALALGAWLWVCRDYNLEQSASIFGFLVVLGLFSAINKK